MTEQSRFKLWKYIVSAHRWLSGSEQQDELPEKIRISIDEQQDSSERLIGWIQIVILVIFALLYSTVPNTRPTEADFEPVPFFLGAYFLFTCMRLYMAYRGSLKFWVLVASILMDMGLLIGLIWSFHVQYMQPPAFYLKSPTLLYIFIFISLRALRFDPGYVLLSGLVGAMGWLVLVLIAIMDISNASVITRDYVLYLTSSKVLLGGELDKILSILLVTGILTLAIARGRHLLIHSIVQSTTAENLSHFVPESVAAQIVHAEGPLIDTQTETSEASILFVDLISFTSLAQKLSPEDLILTLNEYFSVISEPIERNNGVINQFQGDAILASFNLPVKDSDHACSAVTTALEIQDILEKHRFPGNRTLSVRAGVNTGVVVGGFVGTPNRLSYTLYGDDVNIAARLQQLSKKRNTSNLISLRTRQLCDDKIFSFAAKGEELLRGRSSPVQVFEASFRSSHRSSHR